MNSIGKSVIKKVAGLEVVCRELTVAQVRQLMESSSSGSLVDDFLFSDVRLGDFVPMTTLTAAQIDDLHPSELAEVLKGCKEANPDFFAMVARLSKPVAK